ncbi:lysine biosynthesis protein LysX [Dethiosulfovibrio salsuginis]|nr:lysine biosynthesis protein LysX [Dethiosulfovibrio salsuginis]
MTTLWILYTRLRAEEKMLKKAADDRGISCRFVDIRGIAWPGGLDVSEGDVALCRCVSHGHNLAIAKLMESRGVRTVNHSSVMEACGDKVITASILDVAGIPQPEYRVAFSQEEAVNAAESLGYPVVFKPPVGSWGRLISKVNDKDCAESLVEHKSFMGPNHGTFFIQEYVEKPGYDVRALVVGGKPISAIKRASSHWITNTARGAEAQSIPLDDSLTDVLSSVYKAFGGDLLAVDLFQNGNSWSVNEVNGQAEFHGSVEGSGVDVAGAIISHCKSLMEGDK